MIILACILFLWGCSNTGEFEDDHSSQLTNLAFVHFAAPRYSPLARKIGMEGTVHIRVQLGPDCRAEKVSASDGSVLFIDDVTAAAQQWQFLGCRQGQTLQFAVHFNLTGGRSNDWAATTVEYAPANDLLVGTVSGDPIIYDSVAAGLPLAAEDGLTESLGALRSSSSAEKQLESVKQPTSRGSEPSPKGGVMLGLNRFLLPIYPPLARLARISGDVHVSTTLDDHCHPTQLTVTDGDVLLRTAVLRSLTEKEWVFACNGASSFTLTFRFQLRGDETNEWTATRYEFNTTEQLVLVETSPPDLTLFERGRVAHP